LARWHTWRRSAQADRNRRDRRHRHLGNGWLPHDVSFKEVSPCPGAVRPTPGSTAQLCYSSGCAVTGAATPAARVRPRRLTWGEVNRWVRPRPCRKPNRAQASSSASPKPANIR
jgi:hypothetical protein